LQFWAVLRDCEYVDGLLPHFKPGLKLEIVRQKSLEHTAQFLVALPGAKTLRYVSIGFGIDVEYGIGRMQPSRSAGDLLPLEGNVVGEGNHDKQWNIDRFEFSTWQELRKHSATIALRVRFDRDNVVFAS